MWTDTVRGGAEVLGATLLAPVMRRRYNRWGATEAEVASRMPGDELVTTPRLGYTRAVAIEAPPAAVWPWLIQLGQGRGGLYSVDGLENLLGCDIHSASRVLPEHQRLEAGDLVRLGPVGYPCFRVAEVAPGVSLVLVSADPRPPHLSAAPDAPSGIATWQWQLRPDGDGTRVLARQRLTYPPSMGNRVLWHLVEPVAFVMEHEMLQGLKRRAESARPASGAAS